ncbi:CocE/NonD family hydrolase [Streptomyces sp. NPDC058867]|uniref:CocE/NonD family hydrolase n=1 Tax=unclassified Streptomyces TaxID=2593676 RepID=UPI00367F4C87
MAHTRLSSLPASEVSPGDERYTYGLSRPDPAIGITCEYDVKLPARDGVLLECDVFRPDKEGQYPVIVALAPYTRAGDGMPMIGVEDRGGVGTRLELFEQPNPEFWIPRGYVYVTVNPRGFHGSEGKHQAMLQSQHEDFYDAVEWAAEQPWSTGKVGIAGISYYALSQYGAASLRPPHLCAAIPWEGLTDPYRDILYRGGIRCGFGTMFMFMMDSLKNEALWRNSYLRKVFRHRLLDDTWLERGSGLDLSTIEVPLLSVGNLSDVDLHLRGNVEAFMAASSPHKKLRLYAGTHWGSAYQPWATREMLRFFDHWLKGADTGLEREPAVDIDLRTGPDTFTHVHGDSWPLPQTEWLRLHIDTGRRTLDRGEVAEEHTAQAEWGQRGGRSRRVTFGTEPLKQDLSIAGPVTCRIWVSSTTRDADITVELHDIDADGQETLFPYYYHGSDDEPVSRGWLRASHRALDPERSLPYRPFHTHAQNDWLTPGVPVPLDIEIWPTSMVFKAGHRIEITVHAGPHKRRGERGKLGGRNADQKRSGVYRIASRGSGRTTLHTGGRFASWIDLPTLPAQTRSAQVVTVQDGTFQPKVSTGRIGDTFEFVNTGVDYHTSTETSGLGLWDSQLIRGSKSHNPETWPLVVPWSGTYTYRDETTGGVGSIALPPQLAPAADGTLHVTLGTRPTPPETRFEAEVRHASGPWQKVDPAVVASQFILPVTEPGVVEVRARLVGPRGNATGWSPPGAHRVD